VQPSEITEILNRPISQELLARDVTRLAYVARPQFRARVKPTYVAGCVGKECSEHQRQRMARPTAASLSLSRRPRLGEVDPCPEQNYERGCDDQTAQCRRPCTPSNPLS